MFGLASGSSIEEKTLGTVIDKVIDQIIENRKNFEDFCFSLTDEELDRPVPDSNWLVRDFAAHLATLDPAMQLLFEATVRGEKLQKPEGGDFDVDAHNEPLVVDRRGWTMEQVFDEGRKNRAILIDVLRKVTDEQTQGTMYFAADAKRKAGDIPFGLFLAGWAWHDPIHTADMLRGLPERATDPNLKAWIENPFVNGYQKAMNPT
jgi:hypothetical protein